MRNIILPVDFSEQTEIILEKALDYLPKEDVTLRLVHVSPIDVGFIIGDVGFQYLPELEKTSLKLEAQKIQELQKKLQEKGYIVRAKILQGIPSEEIINYAKKHKAHLIVMGSHGRSAFMEAFLGSVSHSVLKNSPVPVLLIPIPKD